ncbi:MAG TPA: hypothetical protein VF088_14075 [Pyrinomonadaceae bacterium]
MRCFLAEALDVSIENVTAFVLRGQGDTMVTLPRFSTCAGIPIPELLPKDKIEAIVKRTANGGAEIVALLKTGSAYYVPSAAAVQMTESILKDKKKSCRVLLILRASTVSMVFTLEFHVSSALAGWSRLLR